MSVAATTEYAEYVRGAWSRFMANPARARASKVTAVNARMAVHNALVLAAGAIYHLTGTQPRRIPISETFQSAWMLWRELARCGLRILREMRIQAAPRLLT